MLSQQKLLKVINADMKVCRDAKPTDQVGRDRQILELATLTSHLQWAIRAGDDQVELEKIVSSLEDRQAKTVLRGYQHWREQCTKSS
jgi:hypothetical protein